MVSNLPRRVRDRRHRGPLGGRRRNGGRTTEPEREGSSRRSLDETRCRAGGGPRCARHPWRLMEFHQGEPHEIVEALIAGAVFGAAALSSSAFAQDKGMVGISMPTKSSARWIADGDNMVKVLEGQGLQDRSAIRRGQYPQPARADREHGHQGRQGAGHRRHRRHHPLRRASIKPTNGHQGHRLRPPDPATPKMSITTPPSTTSRWAYCRRIDRRALEPESRGKYRSTSNCSAARPDDNNAFFFYDGAMPRPAALYRQGKLVVASQGSGHG